ncbi:MAG: ferredoxin [Candidatus Omnitrophota bacterium]
MNVKVDADACIGCSLCVATCPEVFKMEGDKAVTIAAVAPKEVEGSCQKATDECPVTAIILS